jgi:SH3 domain-binding glutamic acid-rich protein
MNSLSDITGTVQTTTSEEAVEYGELATFLRLNETWDESIEETRPTLPAKPIGVPGASSPSQMAKPAHRALFDASPGASPLQRGVALASASPANKESLRKRNETEFDVGDELSGYGLQGVKVTDDELLALVEELGLGGDEAGDLVKGLSDSTDKADKGSGSSIGGSEQVPSATESEVEPKPELAVPVTQEEVKTSKGDDTREAETEVADAAST